MISINDIRGVYFLGIGGIGMSALARYFKYKGVEVSGYDRTSTPLTRKLEKEGMKIHYNEDPNQIPEQIDIIIYTPAIPAEHKEWKVLKSMNLPILKRAEVLGLISESFKTIAIAGTHGKTSTSSMTSVFLRGAGLDVSAFLGGIVKDFESNFVYGESDWVVVEADEFDRSFMHLHPEVAVLLSLDADHLDIYGEHSEMLKTFQEFSLQVRKGGKLLVSSSVAGQMDDSWKKRLLEKEIELYSFGVEEGWFRASNVSVKNHRFAFDFLVNEKRVLASSLAMPGSHNLSNATGAIGICQLLGLDPKLTSNAIQGFLGINRRFDYQVQNEKHIYIDDYAHHPTEIAAAMKAARELYPRRKLTVIFQPHLFSRTRDFMDGFAQELRKADELVLMEIYPAREEPIKGITTQVLKKKIGREDVIIETETEIVKRINDNKKDIDVLMTLGAGNIDRLVDPLREILAK